MKISSFIRWLSKDWLNRGRSCLALASATVMCSATLAYACDGCQRAFQEELLQGVSKSPHQAELLQLMSTGRSDASLQLTGVGQDAIAKPVLPNSDTPTLLPARASNESTNDSGVVSAASLPKGVSETHAAVPKGNRGIAGKLPPTGDVPHGTKPDKKFKITMTQGETFLGNGVMYKGFFVNGKIPGPTIIVDEGDVVELTVENNGNVPHGLSVHSEYTQTAKYFGKILPGETRSHSFRAVYPGVYMYHCAPGGHAIPMHVLLGQYGMIVVKPKTNKFKLETQLGRKPDIEIYLLQHELYRSGKEAIEGQALYTMFNGKLFRYAESPIKARPGDYVRIYFLNVGPNNISTFHIVGVIWDYAYWQGNPAPENTFVGGQSVIAGPSDSWVVEFRIPNDEGPYLMLTHAVGSATRGAIGIISASKDAERTALTLAEGPDYTAEQLADFKAKAVREVAAFEPGSDELRTPVRLAKGETQASVMIKGNSYYPKVIEVPVGTTVEWTNEDVFTFFDGEFAGIHNVVGIMGPENFASSMLGHAERFSHTFTKVGEYTYMCTPHPYMRGIVRVVDKK